MGRSGRQRGHPGQGGQGVGTFLEVDTAMDISGSSGVVDDDHQPLKVGERDVPFNQVRRNEGARDVRGTT